MKNRNDSEQLVAGEPRFVRSVQATRHFDALSIAIPAGAITASTITRSLGGIIVEYGMLGHTSAGPLKVARGALSWADDLTRVKLTREHDRGDVRGHATSIVEVDGKRLRGAFRVSDGITGDAALAEAADHTRDALSIDVVDATVEGDTITAATLIAVGQVGIPAFEGSLIDTIAAARAAAADTRGDSRMTEEQRARLRELTERQNLTAEERAELDSLTALAVGEATAEGEEQPAEEQPPAPEGAAATQPVAASRPLVPSGVPAPSRAPATTGTPRGALDRFVSTVCEALRPGGGGARAIQAAFTDVTQTGVGGDVSAPGWSGELWSGVEYVPEYTPLLASGPLTTFEGKGWRWVIKPVMADYAGDKAAVPSAAVTVEPGTWEAARLATGNDFDRKFYDFPNEDFLRSYVQAVGESTRMQIDEKAHAYILAHATASGLTSTTILGAAAKAVRAVKAARMGRATFVILSDADFDGLMSITESNVPAFLDMFGIDPRNFTSSDTLAANTVIAGVRQAATVRTLGGDSPIRVSAQHLANGGIDEAFFTYWAIEEHSDLGIQKATKV